MAYEYEIEILDQQPGKMTIRRLSDTESDVEQMTTQNIFASPSAEALQLGYLPPCVKAVSPIVEESFIVLVENKPQMRNITFSSALCHHEDEDLNSYDHIEKQFDIPIPWTHWFMRFAHRYGENKDVYSLADVYLYFSDSRLMSLDHKFYHPWLPNNLYDTGYSSHGGGRISYVKVATNMWKSLDRLCTGLDYSVYPKINFGDPNSLRNGFNGTFEAFMTDFWSAPFNCDAGTSLMYPLIVKNPDNVTCPECGDTYEGTIDDYTEHHRCLAEAEVEYCSNYLFGEWAKTPFEDVLKTGFHKALVPFTYMDFINTISDFSKNPEYDFKTIFEEALDFEKAIKVVNPDIVKNLMEKSVVAETKPHSGYWLDPNGQWRDANGKFASHQAVANALSGDNVPPPDPIISSLEPLTFTISSTNTSTNNTYNSVAYAQEYPDDSEF